MTWWRRGRKAGFSARESGVGGILVVVPRAREGMGGVVGSSESRKVPEGCDSWMYWWLSVREV